MEDGACRHHLVWRAGPGWRMVSSAVLGGGLGERGWVLNAQVRPGYARMDPAQHLAELAAAEGLTGPGVGLMTAAQVDDATWAEDTDVTAVVTTGIGVPTWAAAAAPASASFAPSAPDAGPAAVALPGRRYVPGTINILAVVPAPVGDAGLVNLLATATEAKVQALLDAGYDCSGTPSDAVCIAVRTPAPGLTPDLFGGPRSTWGARLARAVHAAVLAGAELDRTRRASGPRPDHAVPGPACCLGDLLLGATEST
ncbi:Adenosylcobinamide amidohydrolase [Kitasatospora sp. MMS16-BH015]|uniref:adenosylcobinamide amidohydrolase n=1 Tax=Kitasatospora sp. MMS16-BH015 TaxID=2018025 RepID=UPI000CA11746|nr:adenosylcobinamide amidohydrolase [Kitasatospora sp. MMS16-BH015]AUG75488.1 Adenosylcobinamide amidohydrolase [Kitasatospora sp. MMS16-BH015]